MGGRYSLVASLESLVGVMFSSWHPEKKRAHKSATVTFNFFIKLIVKLVK